MKSIFFIATVLLSLTTTAQDCSIAGNWYRITENKDSLVLVFSIDHTWNLFWNGEAPLTRAEQLSTMDPGLTEEDYYQIADTAYYKILDSKLPRKEGLFYSQSELKGSRFYFTFLDCNKMLMETSDGSKAEFTRND